MSSRKLISFDWAVKRLLRSKANFAVLEGFLSELLKDDIVILEVLESESNKDTREQHLTRVDLLVRNRIGGLVIIEVQADRQDDYLQRILFGVSRCVVEHLPEGVDYGQIKKVISVSVVYFDLGSGADYVYHGSTSFRGIHFNDELRLDEEQRKAYGVETPVGLYPEYYLLKVNSFNDIAKDGLDQWIYFLKNESIKPEFDAKGLAEAKETLDVLRLDDRERREYEYWQLELHQRASMVQSSYARVRREGKAEGKAEGEIAKAIEIARSLLELLDDATIATKTGLDINTVKNLRNDL